MKGALIKSSAFPRTEAPIDATFHDFPERGGRVVGEIDQDNTYDGLQIASAQLSSNNYRPFCDYSETLSSEAAREDLTNSDNPLLELAPLAQLTSSAGPVSLEVLHECCPRQGLRPLLSMLHLASNNLLFEPHTSEAFELLFQKNGLGLLKAFPSAQLPAAKAIARKFLPPAIHSSNVHIVRLLLDTGVDPNASLGYHGETCLKMASAKGDIEIIRTILEYGADLNATHSSGSSLLETAIQQRQTEVVQLLLQHGANVNPRPVQRTVRTHLGTAVAVRHYQLVELLLNYGADVNVQWPKWEGGTSTALHDAVQSQ